MPRNIFFLLFLVYCSNLSLIGAAPKICLNNSTCLLGKRIRNYDAFLGIPYAEPPLRDLRFSNPVEAPLWKGTRSARLPRPDCIQKNYNIASAPVSGSENCLYLNVYVPKFYSYTDFPVLFYIHGGGFFSGSASHSAAGPDNFMDEGIAILVVASYRLGPFGFLSANDEELPGNLGLKDQNLALQWVQKHISAFGGDPNNVTIFGHGAGAACAHFHMLSPASKGLFKRAILISGNANAPYAMPLTEPRWQAVELAQVAGIKGAEYLNNTQLAKALRKLSKFKLLSADNKLRLANSYSKVHFRPSIEDSNWPNAFLTQEAYALLLSGCNTISVPSIIINVPARGEGLVIARLLASNEALRTDFNRYFIGRLGALLDIPDVNALDNLVSVYMHGVYELNDWTLNGFLELLGDAYFIYPAYKTIQNSFHTENLCTHSTTTETSIDLWESSSASSFSGTTSSLFDVNASKESENSSNVIGIVNFDYHGPSSLSEIYTNSIKFFGAVHGDDLRYLFTLKPRLKIGSVEHSFDEEVAKRYVQLFIVFAYKGELQHSDELSMSPCTEKSLVEGQCQYMSFVNGPDTFRVDSKWNIKRMQVWDEIYEDN